MKKTTDQAYEILEDAAINTNQWPREKATPVNAVGGTDNEVLNNLVNHVAQLTKQLNRQQGTANSELNRGMQCHPSEEATAETQGSRQFHYPVHNWKCYF